MKNLTDKKNLIRNFSKAARIYDKYADIQRAAACELISRLPEGGFERILEIGCGTGIYTQLLRERFINSVLKAVDISPEMVRVAREKFKTSAIDFEVLDAEVSMPAGKFDLVTSNACFQWFGDLESAFKKYKDRLSPGGVFSFSFFGPKTYWELDAVLKEHYKSAGIPAARFISKEDLSVSLGRSFRSINIDEVRFCEKFSGLAEFLSKIKFTGTSGNGLQEKKFFGPKSMRIIEKAFRAKFGAIQATHQVFFCHCLNS